MEPLNREDLETYIESVYDSVCSMANDGKQPDMDQNLSNNANSHIDMEYTSTPRHDSIVSQKKRKPQSPLQVLYESLDVSKGENTDILRKLIEAMESRMTDMENIVTEQLSTIETLSYDNNTLQSRCQVNEGRITRLEKLVEDLREETVQIIARSMKDNIIFQGVPETPQENVRDVLTDFLRLEMHIEHTEDIVVNKVHRMGAKGTYTRSIIANISDEGKQLIWKNLRNLKGKKVSVYTQLPRELAERKRTLLPNFKAARAQNQQAKWAGAKLIVNDKVSQVTRDKVHSRYGHYRDCCRNACQARTAEDLWRQ